MQAPKFERAEPMDALAMEVLPMEISEAEDSVDDDDSGSEGLSEGYSDDDSDDDDSDDDDDDDDLSCSSSDWSVTDMEQELQLFQRKSPGGQQQPQPQPQPQPPKWQLPQPSQGTKVQYQFSTPALKVMSNINMNNPAPQTPGDGAMKVKMMMTNSFNSSPVRDAPSGAIPGALLERMTRAESTVGLSNLISPRSSSQESTPQRKVLHPQQQQQLQSTTTVVLPTTTAINRPSASLSATTESRNSAGVGNDHKDPQELFLSLLRHQGQLPQAKPVSSTMLASSSSSSFFVRMTQANIDAYTMDKITAVRQDNVVVLSTMHQQQGQILQCCNRYGESIIHAACRRGAIQCLQYLVSADCGVSLRVMDDYHRNPFHDACWTVEPNFQVVQILLDHCPDLLLLQDKRGCSPLQYVRRENWAQWCHYLKKQPIHKLLPQSQAVYGALDQ
jgi:hypothetical protein